MCVWSLPPSLHCYVPFEKLNSKYSGAQQLEFGELPVLRDREKEKGRKKEKGSRKRKKGIKRIPLYNNIMVLY